MLELPLERGKIELHGAEGFTVERANLVSQDEKVWKRAWYAGIECQTGLFGDVVRPSLTHFRRIHDSGVLWWKARKLCWCLVDVDLPKGALESPFKDLLGWVYDEEKNDIRLSRLFWKYVSPRHLHPGGFRTRLPTRESLCRVFFPLACGS